MKISILAVLNALSACAVAVPTRGSHVVHEKREVFSTKWARSSTKLPRDVLVPMSIGLTQRNLENGYDLLMDISDPKSANYGKHWSMDKIADTFAASETAVTSVKSWLAENGIDDDRVELSKGRNWLKFELTVEEAENLLQTKYNLFEQKAGGKARLACDDYSVPSALSEHIDFITPTIHFDAMVKRTPKRRQLVNRSLPARSLPVRPQVGGKAAHVVRPAVPAAEFQPNTTFSLANCNTYITPDCLRSLYNFPNGTLDQTSYGIVEYTPQAHKQTDLDAFYSKLSSQIPSGTGPIIDLIDGAVVQTTYTNETYQGEPDLDLEFAIALVYPQKVTLYQVGDMIGNASFNNFLDALDASYCTSGGGDDPENDQIFPDTAPGGSNTTRDCGTIAPASVISTSYGYNEADLPATYEIRQCNEYMKLGLAGVTILYSSGDYGVAGNSGACCTNAQCANGTYNTGGSGTFNPSFPATCPYVTSVGATQVAANASVTAPETACESVIYSGGGFSNVFAQPSYQASAVASYYASFKPTYTATQYNNSQTVRGYPDVAANGANYVTVIDGELTLLFGTSASSPVFGSLITLINNERIAVGKSPVGFLNPTLYAHPGAFNDITSGGNQGCGTPGFTAVEGWDPVTGLGTPNYSALLSIFMALP